MKFKNFMTSIYNSVGSNIFRNWYVDDQDVLKDGDLSCAYYVSTILTIHGMIDRVHFRVSGTVFAMKNSGWYEIDAVREGCVIVWHPIKQGEGEHEHIGFYVGDDEVISNRSSLRVPGTHRIHYSGLDKDGTQIVSKVKSIFWHDALNVR